MDDIYDGPEDGSCLIQITNISQSHSCDVCGLGNNGVYWFTMYKEDDCDFYICPTCAEGRDYINGETYLSNCIWNTGTITKVSLLGVILKTFEDDLDGDGENLAELVRKLAVFDDDGKLPNYFD